MKVASESRVNYRPPSEKYQLFLCFFDIFYKKKKTMQKNRKREANRAHFTKKVQILNELCEKNGGFQKMEGGAKKQKKDPKRQNEGNASGDW